MADQHEVGCAAAACGVLAEAIVVPEFGSQAAVAALSLVAYPAAKERLVESGVTREEVERLPVGQVIAIDAKREYRRIADDLEKRFYVPYAAAKRMPGPAEMKLVGTNEARPPKW